MLPFSRLCDIFSALIWSNSCEISPFNGACLLSLHPLCGGEDLLFLLSPPAAAAVTCFCSHSKTPTRIISKYLQYAYWPWGICLVNYFFAFFSFFNKIQDGRLNPMAHATAQTASSILFMFGLKRPYPGRELKSFWCDSDNKNFDFFTFLYFSGYFCFAHFGHHKNLVV